MTLRHMFRKPLFDRDTGGSSGGVPAQNSGNPGGGENPLEQNDNNNNEPEDEFASFWDDSSDDDQDDDLDPDEDDKRGGRDNNSDMGNREEQINAFFDGRVPDMQMSEEMQEAINNNDLPGYVKASQTAFKKQLSAMYRNVVTDTQQLIQNRVNSAVKEAVKQATNTVGADQAVQQMHEQLGYTRDSAIAPVAKAVLAKAMRKASGTQEAIQMVDGYFNALSQKRSGGGKRNGGFNRGNNPSSGSSGQDIGGEEDFMELLGPGNAN